jgi:hypothetical protein
MTNSAQSGSSSFRYCRVPLARSIRRKLRFVTLGCSKEA